MKIVLGVGGGIAAYKAAELARLLMQQGHQVQTVMTAGGQGQPPSVPGEHAAASEHEAEFEAEPDEAHHDESPDPGPDPSAGSGHGGPDGDQ